MTTGCNDCSTSSTGTTTPLCSATKPIVTVINDRDANIVENIQADWDLDPSTRFAFVRADGVTLTLSGQARPGDNVIVSASDEGDVTMAADDDTTLSGDPTVAAGTAGHFVWAPGDPTDCESEGSWQRIVGEVPVS